MNGYVRVSEILKRFSDYSDVDPVMLEEKAKIGTNVHQAIIADCAGDFVLFETDRAQAYFESYKMWQKFESRQISQIPRLYCDTYMITGECDGLIQGLQGEILIDWKCSASSDKTTWNMQAHFYFYLLQQNGYKVAKNMFWVHLGHNKHTFRDSKTGAIKRVEYTPKEPVVYEFKFDEKVLSECLDEAVKYWEEKNAALCVD